MKTGMVIAPLPNYFTADSVEQEFISSFVLDIFRDFQRIHAKVFVYKRSRFVLFERGFLNRKILAVLLGLGCQLLSALFFFFKEFWFSLASLCRVFVP
jgi:hypothetical protein